jgi:hypothetical protein
MPWLSSIIATNSRPYPAIIIPAPTPADIAAVYKLRSLAVSTSKHPYETHDMTAPRSCKKKTSAIDKGAMVSEAPDPNPMRILAAKKLPYEVEQAAHAAQAR